MWICDNCKDTTEELSTYEERHDAQSVETMTDYDCNCCNGEYVEAVKCPVCDEWQIEAELHEACEDCLETILTADNMLEYIKCKELRQDYFVGFWTGAKVEGRARYLTDICENDWDFVYKSHYSNNAVKSLTDYIKENLDHFVEWFVKERK